MNKLLVISLALFGLSACDSHDHSEHAHSKEEHMQMMKEKQVQESEVKSESQKYICPMHPHIHGEEGDTCPICNMYLTPQETNSEPEVMHDNHQNHDGHSMNNSKAKPSFAANLSAQRIQNANIKTTDVLFGEIKQEYTAFAKVVSQNKAAVVISMRDNGWIEKVAKFEELDQVKKDDFLFEFYSQEIKSAQIDYIIALQQGNKAQIQSAKVRLRNFGVQEKAIQELTKDKKVTHTTKFYAPISGYIKKINIQQGQNLKSGELALLIQPTEELWLNAFIDKDKLDLVNDSQIELVNQQGKTELQSILPEIDSASQNHIARLKLSGSNLQNGDFLDIKFVSKSKQGLIIPKSAILNDSGHSYVFVQNGKSFNAVMIKTAEYDSNNIIVTEGLSENDKVVVNGQFLIDSEAKLQSSFGSMSGHQH
jgi:Cu(I)/Ag(I) efflux system membrane fusion protein